MSAPPASPVGYITLYLPGGFVGFNYQNFHSSSRRYSGPDPQARQSFFSLYFIDLQVGSKVPPSSFQVTMVILLKGPLCPNLEEGVTKVSGNHFIL
jgi:hypothetical protein